MNCPLGALLYHIDNKYDDLSVIEDIQPESLVRTFVWAQWDCIHQVLYYIHYRKPARCLVEGEENEVQENAKLSPTLSGLQFHDDLPHETVVSFFFIFFKKKVRNVYFLVEYSNEFTTHGNRSKYNSIDLRG